MQALHSQSSFAGRSQQALQLTIACILLLTGHRKHPPSAWFTLWHQKHLLSLGPAWATFKSQQKYKSLEMGSNWPEAPRPLPPPPLHPQPRACCCLLQGSMQNFAPLKCHHIINPSSQLKALACIMKTVLKQLDIQN